MNTNIKRILVTGDMVQDYHIYEGDRSSPDSSAALGTELVRRRGGAMQSFQLLQALSAARAASSGPEKTNGHSEPALAPYLAEFGLNTNVRFPPALRTYALWRPFPRNSKAPNDGKVWRLADPLGYGPSPAGHAPFPAKRDDSIAPNPGFIVIDDAGLGFRFDVWDGAWPVDLESPSADSDQWILLKTAHPVGEGDLWRKVSENCRDRLIVLVGIDDLRRLPIRLSHGVSWEQSAIDLVGAIAGDAALAPLRHCRHAVVVLGCEGALHVDLQDPENPTYHLIFDAQHQEGEWSRRFQGNVTGLLSCMTACIADAITKSDVSPGPPGDAEAGKAFEGGMASGLCAMRKLLESGHGAIGSPKPGPDYPALAESAIKNPEKFARCYVPNDAAETESWTMLRDWAAGARNEPLHGVARRVALIGPGELVDIPNEPFGKMLAVDRTEIERLRHVQRLIRDYVDEEGEPKPLSIAVFGPPGSGKSFGVKQIAESILGDRTKVLEFNLSQFASHEELIGLFHQVRDARLSGKLPLVFWDEFDSKSYYWLQYLLAPMQDGKFQEGQITHPIGKCVFVFAGGTCATFDQFGPRSDASEDKERISYAKFRLLKGPDFMSRLAGYLNVLGPNQGQLYDSAGAGQRPTPDPCDVYFPVRRALLLRSLMSVSNAESLNIDSGVLSALLEIGEYKHGARSMEKIVLQMKSRAKGSPIGRSHIPPETLLSLHVNAKEFLGIVDRDNAFLRDAWKLAEPYHEFYRQLAKRQGWTVRYDQDFDTLPPAIKASNRAAARRIAEVLSLVGLLVAPMDGTADEGDAEVETVIHRNIEILARAEHVGWMRFSTQNGWRPAIDRLDEQKLHNALVDYGKLSEKDKEKDRDAVRNYQAILKSANYKIVTSLRKKQTN